MSEPIRVIVRTASGYHYHSRPVEAAEKRTVTCHKVGGYDREEWVVSVESAADLFDAFDTEHPLLVNQGLAVSYSGVEAIITMVDEDITDPIYCGTYNQRSGDGERVLGNELGGDSPTAPRIGPENG